MDYGNKFKLNFIEKPDLSLELLNFICGDFIGSGCYRTVFEYCLDPNYVVKIEDVNGGCNWVEYRLWKTVEYTEHAKWFAPVKYISKNGSILIQKRAKKIETKSEKRIPDKIPHYFSDLSWCNFGWIKNQLVCVDYSSALEKGFTFALNNKMQPTKNKLKWE